MCATPCRRSSRCAPACARPGRTATTRCCRCCARCTKVLSSVGDPLEFTATSRRFHEGLVNSCGNETLKLVVGALESLWTTREEAWARDADQSGGFPDA